MPSTPARRSKKPRRPRCAYRENGRQCVRDGEGAPIPLCRAHSMVVAEVGRPPSRGSAVVEVLGDLLSGKKITRDRFGQAVDEVAQGFGMGGNIAQGYYPDVDQSGRTQHGSDARPFRWWEFFRQPGRSPSDHEQQAQQHEQATRRRARVVMGFAESEPVSKESVQGRRRAMARKNHPDHGTDDADKKRRTEKMMEINAAADILIAELENA